LEAPYSSTPDLALLHLDEPADPVLLVDDEVAGLELERVDLALAARRHLPHVPGRRLLAGDVLAGDQHQPVRLVDEALGDGPDGDRDDVRVDGVRRVEVLDEPGGYVALAQRLDHALGGTVSEVDHDHPVTLLAPPLDVAYGALHVPAVGLHRFRG
jgi:hypothetical protein